ncbi:MAG: hypothetical protein QF464_19205, partial [Myxococcota bacterium]|nr:hypothetical protein [Myxococcota bacterium]
MSEVIYLHGLESGPGGGKARWLRDHFGGVAVDLDTSAARASKAAADARDAPWDHRCPDLEAAFTVPMQRARAAITSDTKLVIGSSFGGAVLMNLVHEGSWSGPCLFIASAGTKLTGHSSLPAATRAILLHGRHDDIVPLEDSRRVAAAGDLGVQLWEIGDGHRMKA